ncbi:MAG TPA: hypothetical protein VFH83_00825 [Spirochaetia bacterium]|nr:hypothetical protein [Spirochaetia bacterium]
MNRPRRVFLAFLLVLGLTAPVFGQTTVVAPVEIPSARASALGGLHAALADDLGSLFSNPAGFALAGPQLSVSEVTLHLTGPVFSIADLVYKGTTGTDFTTLLQTPSVISLLSSLFASGTLNGPLALGYVGGGLGFGIFNASNVTFTTVGTPPTVTASIGEDVIFAGGYAFAIPLPASWKSKLDIGATLKAFARADVTLRESILDVLTLLAAPDVSIIYNQPFELDAGIGVDVGIRYSWNDTISFGVVGRNLYAPALVNSYTTFSAFGQGAAPTMSFGTVPLDLAAGFAFTPNLGALEPYLGGLKVLLDYQDILDFLTHPTTASNPVLHVGLGIEFQLLQILALRAGFNEGYFSAGAGLNLSVFRLNLTMYGSELSLEPGLRPAYNLIVGLEFRY